MHWIAAQDLGRLGPFMLVFFAGFFLGRRFRRPVDARTTWRPNPNITDADIAAELHAGRKIEAIKLYRQRDGSGLREAKQAVETMAQQLHLRR